MEAMTTILITGANKGLGHEAARRLLAAGHDVWIGARDPQRGQAAADELGRALRRARRHRRRERRGRRRPDRGEGGLDVLVNNAGISGGRVPVPEVTADDVARVLETNVARRRARDAGVRAGCWSARPTR